jgi:hypothetical protein
MSEPSLNEIIPLLRELAAVRQPGLSQAADTAITLYNGVQNVKSQQPEYNQLATDACELLYVIAEELREKGQRNIDDKLKLNLEDLTGVLEKIIELAQANAVRSSFTAFWYSDADNLKTFRDQLEQHLRVFGIRSFSDLRYKFNARLQQKSDSKTTAKNTDPNPPPIDKDDYGTAHQGSSPRNEMFGGAKDFKVDDSEFNDIGGNMNKTSFHGKNVAPNFGKIGSQSFS